MWNEICEEDEMTSLNLKINLLKDCNNNEEKNKNRKFIVMMIINAIIILLTSLIPLGLISSFGIQGASIISLLSMVGLTGINTAIGTRKIKNIDNSKNNITEQIVYLEDIKLKIEEEAKKSNIDIKNISNKFDWRKQLKLIKTYNTYKKAFKKHYKRDDLYEVLQYSGYDNAESYYLYTRTKEEFENKNKQKVLKKENIMNLWND